MCRLDFSDTTVSLIVEEILTFLILVSSVDQRQRNEIADLSSFAQNLLNFMALPNRKVLLIVNDCTISP